MKLDSILLEMKYGKDELDSAFKKHVDTKKLSNLTDLVVNHPNDQQSNIWEEYSRLTYLNNTYQNLCGEFDVLEALATEGSVKDTNTLHIFNDQINDFLCEVHQYILNLNLKPDYGEKGAIITIKAIQDSNRLCELAGDLANAYKDFSRIKNFGVETIQEGQGDIILRISGNSVYAHLKNEQGRHSFVYNESGKGAGRNASKRYTGVISVSVSPDVDKPEFDMDSRKIDKKVFGSSSPGGQNANNNRDGVVLTDEETGISARVNTRSQQRSYNEAYAILQAKLVRYLSNGQGDQRVKLEELPLIRKYDSTRWTILSPKLNVSLDGKPKYESFFNGQIEPFILASYGITTKPGTSFNRKGL